MEKGPRIKEKGAFIVIDEPFVFDFPFPRQLHVHAGLPDRRLKMAKVEVNSPSLKSPGAPSDTLRVVRGKIAPCLLQPMRAVRLVGIQR